MKIVVMSAVVAVSFTVVPNAPAHAEQPAVAGQNCVFMSVTDPTVQGGDVQTGQINGGPLAVADLPVVDPYGDPTLQWDVLGNPVSVTLVCSIHVGSQNLTHAGADAVSASASGTIAATLPPTTISYVSPEGLPVSLCTEVVVTDRRGESHHLYWDGFEERFSTSDDVPCSLPDGCELSDCSPLDVDVIFVEVVDPAVCPYFAGIAPGVPGIVDVTPEGDVLLGWGLFWDCPPYEW